MVHYRIRQDYAHRHFISFEAVFESGADDFLFLQLPAWRPGRYELGNFAKNVRGFKAFATDGSPLHFVKLNRDLWRIATEGHKSIRITYQYYAADLNAGSSYLDDSMLYINPVNCFFYDQSNANQPYELHFDLPESYQIASGMPAKGAHLLHADNFDHLADCPLIASPDLKHLEYVHDSVTYHIWIQGNVALDEKRLISEFSAFTASTLEIFGDIPCKEYHFLFHFVPYFLRHGVEHCNSTVIAMGPAADFQNDSLFKDLLGISCHELFHTWNVKNIRPLEMMPYDFTRENYSRSGYVYEGVTTYYGDLLLWRSSCINDAEWLEMVEEHVQDHIDNTGRFNMSVAESSFDTWLDGYTPGIPWRKVSIYNEGFLLAMLCDLKILDNTKGERSLDNVMKDFYEQFGKKKIGYTESDYRMLVESANGTSMPEVFDTLLAGSEDYLPEIIAILAKAGVQCVLQPSAKWSEAYFGFSVDEGAGKYVIQSVMPESPGDRAGLWTGDEVLAVNGVQPYKSIQNLLRMQSGHELTIFRKGRRLQLSLHTDQQVWMKKVKLSRLENTDNTMRSVFAQWRSGKK